MNLRRISIEQILILAALLLGAILRFVNLGQAPLSDAEATWALQVIQPELSIANLSIMETGDPPASTFYTVLTGWAFSLFGSSNFLARFWPAISGVLLILFPALISRPNRPHLIGRTSALLEVHHDYGDKTVLLDVHVVWDFSGEARGLEDQPLAWVTPQDLASYEFPAANMPIVAALGKLLAS